MLRLVEGPVSDMELIRAAAAAAGLTARRFAQDVLGVDGRNVRRWEWGKRVVPGTVRVVCAAIIARPAIAIELSMARAGFSEGVGEALSRTRAR